MASVNKPKKFPTWSPTTKLVIGLTIVGVVGALLVRFRSIVGPLILSFILAYVLHPIAFWISDRTKISWRNSVNLVYLLLIILLAGLLTASGVVMFQQVQSLFGIVQEFVTDLPQLADEITAQLPNLVYEIGPYTLDLSKIEIDLVAVSEQIISIVQPLLGQAGNLIASFATSAVVFLGWGVFVVLISYFVMSDAGRVPDFINMIDIEFPKIYDYDIRRMARELGSIWHAFLRGQLIIMILVVISGWLMLTILGVDQAIALALLAGGSKFIPYVGPFIAGIVTAVVAYFQGVNYLGMDQFWFATVAVVGTLILDQIFDNLVYPRVIGSTLGVPPAGVLVAAIIAANLLGLIGLLIAAPVLATIMLVGRYTVRKMFDLDPWPDPEVTEVDISFPGRGILRRIWRRLRNLIQPKKGDSDDRETP